MFENIENIKDSIIYEIGTFKRAIVIINNNLNILGPKMYGKILDSYKKLVTNSSIS